LRCWSALSVLPQPPESRFVLNQTRSSWAVTPRRVWELCPRREPREAGPGLLKRGERILESRNDVHAWKGPAIAACAGGGRAVPAPCRGRGQPRLSPCLSRIPSARRPAAWRCRRSGPTRCRHGHVPGGDARVMGEGAEERGVRGAQGSARVYAAAAGRVLREASSPSHRCIPTLGPATSSRPARG